MLLPARGKQACNTVPSESVHLIVSQGGPPILKASMTKHRNAAKQLGISTPILGKNSKDALGHENKQNEILDTSENTITLFTPS